MNEKNNGGSLHRRANAGLSARNVGVLREYLNSIQFDGIPLDEWAKKHPNTKCVMLTISLDCGCTKKFERLKDIPSKSLKCRHGNFFILYEEEERGGN